MSIENKRTKNNRLRIAALLALPLFLSPVVLASEKDHDEHGEHDEHEDEEEGVLHMDATERAKQGVKTLAIEMRALSENLHVPGEVGLNLYATSQVTPRIGAQIVRRHVRLGDQVAAGDKLLTLSSVEMAEAQGNLIVTAGEWKRVKNLGRKVVSERRYIEAKIAAQQARAKVLAYGLGTGAADQLAAKNDASKAVGAFTLYAKQDGTIMSDDFVLGEFIEPGRVLFEITNEDTVWVDAQLSADDAERVAPGNRVEVQTSNGASYAGAVLQLHHAVNEATRTLSARISVENMDDALHSGQFVTASIETGKTAPVLALPKAAVTLMNAQSHVFVLHTDEEEDELEPTPVLLGAAHGDWVEIKSGLSVGDEVVISQIFLIKSLILKSKMGEGHAH